MSKPDMVTRFWSKVNRLDPQECWEWSAGLRVDGYGQFWTGSGSRSAHRVAFELVNGPIPPGKVVRHRCDNPRCVNPSHLELGDPADNSRDMVRRGRSLAGERHPSAKLSHSDVVRIRERLAAGDSLRTVADLIGISKSTVAAIGAGRLWREVA